MVKFFCRKPFLRSKSCQLACIGLMTSLGVGMSINHDQCFTFGHNSLDGSIPAIPNHKQDLRLVGGVALVSKQKLGLCRKNSANTSWQKSVSETRYAPVGWMTKIQIIQSYMARLTFGQGTRFVQLISAGPWVLCILNTDLCCISKGCVLPCGATPEPEFTLERIPESLQNNNRSN